MPSTTTSCKLELFAIHAHLTDPSVTYRDLFKALENIPAERRFAIQRSRAFVIPRIREQDGRFFITVYDGPIGANPVIFDLQSAQERTEILDRSEFVADITHAVVDPDRRRIAIEYVRRGAKADDIANLIEATMAKEGGLFKDIRVEFAPVVDESFSRSIDQFLRIREAALTVVRPNASWTDHYTELSSLLEESSGDKADLGVRAARGDGLSKEKGIVGIIKSVIRDSQPYLKRAFVKGVRRGEQAETTVSSTKHIRHAVARVTRDTDGRTDESQVFNHLDALARSTDEAENRDSSAQEPNA
jgi:hypothetical protein